MSAPELRFIDMQDALYEQEKWLRYLVLRRPIGLPEDAVLFPFEPESLHLLALESDRVVGCVLFHPESEREGRLYQMAVAEDRQRHGIGRLLVKHLEAHLKAKNF